MTDKLFGTDGVRGIANTELSPALALSLGAAAARVLGKSHRARFVIGRDTRISGTLLEAALSAGLCSQGAGVVSAGVLPTPAVASIVRSEGFDAGVVISASHNPFADNGIKFFGPDGYKLDDALEAEMEGLVPGADVLPRPAGADVGAVTVNAALHDHYIQHLTETLGGLRLDGVKVIVDGANGAAYEVGPRILSDLGADVTAIHCSPNGVNINAVCGSLHPQAMLARTQAEGAAVGMAFDGDADRVLLSDECGNLVDGDRIMLLVGRHLASQGKLPGGTVVGTIMSNMGLEVALRETGLSLRRAPVGDRYVSAILRAEGFVLGGEKSGHILFGHLTTTGDGILTALQVLKVMGETGQPLSTLAGQMTEYPQVLLGVPVTDRQAWAGDADIQRVITHTEGVLAGRGRVNVRASGTEKLVRVMAEGPDKNEIDTLAAEIAALVQKKFGA